MVAHPVREGVVKYEDEEEVLAEAVNTATFRTARRWESRGAAAGAVVGAASLVSVFDLG